MSVVISIPVVLGARKEKLLLGLCMGQSATAASREAGYTPQYGAKVIHDPAMAAIIRECAANLNNIVARLDAKPARQLSR